MECKTMDKLGIFPSLLGFGCMRFPVTPDGKIDEPEAEKMLDKAIAAGITYIDTAYPYHDGASEPFVGKVLKKYDRDSFYLATKLPSWLVNSVEDAERLLNEQLTRLQTDHIDFYLLHALDKEKWEKLKNAGIPEWLAEKAAEGKVRYQGFSFHDTYDVFEDIINYRDWDFCQIQYNYMDTEDGPGTRGYELAEQKQIPIVIMEPIKGGSLASLPEDINNRLTAADAARSTASWALRWVAGKVGVKVVLSGMSTMAQLEDNLATFENFKPLTDEENKLIDEVAAAIRARVKNGCTGCRYCMPCPAGVDIPKNFSIWNHHAMYGNDEGAKREYFERFDVKAHADACVKCGKCESACPQHLPIREQLMQVTADMNALAGIAAGEAAAKAKVAATAEAKAPAAAAETVATTTAAETVAEPEVIPSMDDFKEELERSFHKLKEGDMVSGTVMGVSETEVSVDLGSYSEGIIPIDELSNDPRFSIKADIAVGDKVRAMVISEDNGDGALVLSLKQAADVLAWDELRASMNAKEIFSVKVAEAVNAGVVTYLKGIRAFIPASQIGLSYVEDLDSVVGQTLDVVIITVEEDKKKLVLSGKEVARERAEAEKTARISSLQVGLVTEGVVEKIMPFGAFVRMGDGLSGLVHISQICGRHIKSPNEVVKEGETVKVKILAVKDGKISLSMKAVEEREEVVEDIEEAPVEYSSGESATTGLGALLANLKLN